jgi:glycosyltransferase involved in cell wall biosynthesis
MRVDLGGLSSAKSVLFLFGLRAGTNFVRGEALFEEMRRRGVAVMSYRLYIDWLAIIEASLSQRHPILSRMVHFIQKVLGRLREATAARRSRHCDAVVLVKYVAPRLVDKLRRAGSATIAYDFDDAVWLTGFIGPDAFRDVASRVDVMSCDNEFLAVRAREHCAHCIVVPGPSQVEDVKYFQDGNARSRLNGGITLGWVGSASTIPYLFGIYDAIEAVGMAFAGVTLVVLGERDAFRGFMNFTRVRVVFVPEYNQRQMFEAIQGFTVGLYPLFCDELSKGRGFLKASVYMSAGVPVVASDNGGPIRNLIEDGHNGYLARDQAEWVQKISHLIEQPKEAQRIAERGRRDVEERLSRRACVDALLSGLFD